MYFSNLSDFIAMGTHGFYVWSAYGFALVLLLFNVVIPLVTYKQFWRKQKHNVQRGAVK